MAIESQELHLSVAGLPRGLAARAKHQQQRDQQQHSPCGRELFQHSPEELSHQSEVMLSFRNAGTALGVHFFGVQPIAGAGIGEKLPRHLVDPHAIGDTRPEAVHTFHHRGHIPSDFVGRRLWPVGRLGGSSHWDTRL